MNGVPWKEIRAEAYDLCSGEIPLAAELRKDGKAALLEAGRPVGVHVRGQADETQMFWVWLCHF